MSAAPSPATLAAWIGIVRVCPTLIARVEAEVKAAGFPPLDWYDVLWALDRAEGGRATPGEIESAMLIPQCNLSRLLDRLVEDGLVERRPFPGDRRRQLVEITRAGRDLRRRMWPSCAAAISRHLGEPLGEEEAATLSRLLEKLRAPQPQRSA